MELVVLATVVAIVAVRRYLVSDLLANGNRRLRASSKLDTESDEHELIINGII